MEQPSSCYACDLSAGAARLLGGLIVETTAWRVEHCQGPLGVGTLIVKPKRHCLHVWDLTREETTELGPLLVEATEVVRSLTKPDQVYICLWSHAGWQAGHIHFVLQPVWISQQALSAYPGPALQYEMFKVNEPLNAAAVEAYCEDARAAFARLKTHEQS
jgi:diadenosine tetraphosphate (Ap4A) HIT family hydrolase